VSPVAERSAGAVTIGAELELLRLQRRARQLERVLERLKHRARAADAGCVERAGLHRAVAEFGAELQQVRHRLNAAAPPIRDEVVASGVATASTC